MSKQQTSISYEMFENLKNMFESKDEYDIELAKIYLKEIRFNSDPNDKWTQYYIHYENRTDLHRMHCSRSLLS